MKRIPFALSIALLAAQAALAQQPGEPARGGMHRGGAPMERMAEELGLDDTQKAEVKRIVQEQRARNQAERKNYAASGQRPTREEMQATRQRHEEELTLALSSVLTAEQLEKFKAMHAERRGHMRMGPPTGER
jgi:Spy/CpxP family protein refolding chaperone